MADIVVRNKSDLVQRRLDPGFWVSAKTGQGIPELIQDLGAARRNSWRGEAAVITRSRHRQALEEAARHLARARSETQAELKAECMRLALRAIGRITGRVDLDELLDVVFRDFCIGK
jgi:tRNA modification GTPase